MSNEIQTEEISDFDLNSIFMDDSSDSSIGSVDEVFECVNPHWRVSKEDLKKVLQVVFSFPSKATVYMAVLKVGDKLKVHANNRDALIDAELSLLNKDPYETDQVYFLDTTRLLAFVNSYQSFVLSFDVDGTIYYESSYVRYKLDVVKVSLKDVQINYDLPKDWVKFPLSRSEVGVLRTLYGFAIKLSDSKVLIDSSKAEAFYTLYKYSVMVDTKLDEKVIIRRLDLPSLKEVIDDGIMFAFNKDRIFFKFGLGVISFIRVPYDENSFMYPDTFLTGQSLGSFDADVPLIKRALKLTALFNVTEIDFESSDQDVFMIIHDKARFKIGKCLSNNQGVSFSIGLDTFSKILSTVDCSVLKVDVSEHGVQLACDDLRGVYSLARISISQIKQGKLPPVLSKQSGQTAQVEFQDSEVL